MAQGLPDRVRRALRGADDGGPEVAASLSPGRSVARFAAAPGIRAPAGGGAGFTLVELMVAMAIFAVLGVALIAMLRQSTAFLDRGQAGAELQDVLENVDRQMAADLSNVYIRPSSMEGLPDVRLLCDRVGFDTDGDGVQDTWTQRLSFARSSSSESADPLLRKAGIRAGATGVVDGSDDLKEAEDGDLRAPGGKMEVCWLAVPWRKGEEPGLLTLHRGSRMPLGGAGSFLAREAVNERKTTESRMGITTREEAAQWLRPVLSAVLFQSFEFFSRHTSPEGARLVVGGRLADAPGPDAGGLSPIWDSTRGIHPRGVGADQFFLGKGAASLSDPVDDVFPSRIRMTLVVDRVGSDAATAELARTIGPTDTVIPVDNTRFAPGGDPASRFIKIGREWIRWADRDARQFTVEKRGARGTKPEGHDSGLTVRAGSTLVREYAIPAHREDWND